MRPAVITAVLLLVLMSMLDSAADAAECPHESCKDDPVPCEGMSEEGWVRLGADRCVKAFHTTNLNFSQAEEACKKYKNGHLVSIHSPEELDQVVCAMFRATPGRPPYWIGLYLSFYYENNMVFDWTDETQHNFSKFACGQPNFYRYQEECVEINYSFWGHWNDVSCRFLRPYVCAVKL